MHEVVGEGGLLWLENRCRGLNRKPALLYD